MLSAGLKPLWSLCRLQDSTAGAAPTGLSLDARQTPTPHPEGRLGPSAQAPGSGGAATTGAQCQRIRQPPHRCLFLHVTDQPGCPRARGGSGQGRAAPVALGPALRPQVRAKTSPRRASSENSLIMYRRPQADHTWDTDVTWDRGLSSALPRRDAQGTALNQQITDVTTGRNANQHFPLGKRKEKKPRGFGMLFARRRLQSSEGAAAIGAAASPMPQPARACGQRQLLVHLQL